MSLAKYETFLEVAKTLNMSKAAQNLHQTVQGVSYTITKLELDLDTMLFSRNNKSIALTSDGKALLPYAQDIVRSYKNLQDALSALKVETIGKVKVGGFKYIAAQWIPGIITSLNQQFPNIEVDIILNEYKEIRSDLLNGTIDIAIAQEPNSKLFTFIPLAKDYFVAVVKNNHLFSGSDSLHLKDLKNEKLIVPDWNSDMQLPLLLSDSEIRGSIQYRIKDDRTILSMAQQGIGVAILPKSFTYPPIDSTVNIPLKGCPSKKIGFVYANQISLSPATKQFIAHTKSWLKNNASFQENLL